MWVINLFVMELSQLSQKNIFNKIFHSIEQIPMDSFIVFEAMVGEKVIHKGQKLLKTSFCKLPRTPCSK